MIKMLQTGARIVLGLIYLIFGGMGLMIVFGVIHPEFPPMTAGADAFFKGIMGSGYFFPLLKATETLCGLLLLVNLAAPLALVILAPITLHIILFHAFLTPGAGNLLLPAAMVVLQIVAMSGYLIKYYRPMFSRE
jgi:hypothetical protein